MAATPILRALMTEIYDSLFYFYETIQHAHVVKRL